MQSKASLMKDKVVKEKSEEEVVVSKEVTALNAKGVVKEEVVSGPSIAQKEKTEYKQPRVENPQFSDKSQKSLSTAPPKRSLSKEKPMLKKFKKDGPGKSAGLLIGAVLIVLAGIGSGWFLSDSSAKQSSTGPVVEVIEEDNGVTVGLPIQNGEEKFDEAEGILESGGIDGEGTHHLVREGGPTKYVYLTSTTLDLESFVGKTVLVKGETMAAQSAPWLMDVWVIKDLE